MVNPRSCRTGTNYIVTSLLNDPFENAQVSIVDSSFVCGIKRNDV